MHQRYLDFKEPDVVLHICNPSTWEVKAGDRVQALAAADNKKEKRARFFSSINCIYMKGCKGKSIKTADQWVPGAGGRSGQHDVFLADDETALS